MWLSGCGSSFKLPDAFSALRSHQQSEAGETTGSVAAQRGADAASPSAGSPTPLSTLVGQDPKSDLNLGKEHYRAGNFGDAEKYFRRAVETSPRDTEAWVGLAASYDRLKRFDLADRAYAEAIKLAGPRPEILNNQGYSYLLRGDLRRAREKLTAAQARDPDNPYIRNNLARLAQSERGGKPPP
ncbi:MAG: tetratricopeptide repeat protein [Proteobacteria bacterium]|nr:tetratricopeptide repeat protein [Pseudomonadota bacterium]